MSSMERCTTAGQEAVDGTGRVVQYEHPLCLDRYSFVKSPADLNGALLLKHRGNQQCNSTPPRRGPRWARASLGVPQIQGSFLTKNMRQRADGIVHTE